MVLKTNKPFLLTKEVQTIQLAESGYVPAGNIAGLVIFKNWVRWFGSGINSRFSRSRQLGVRTPVL